MDEKQISIPGWRIIRAIGRGSFGTVYEVEKDDGYGEGIRSALKVISIPETPSEIEAYRDDGYDDASLTALYKSRVEDITAEFRLMNKLKGCNNIVSYEDHTIVQHDHDIGYDIMIRMELLTSLPKYIDQRLVNNPDDEKTVRKLGADICRALERCARHNIIHRDIKPQNIFVNEEGDFKLGDFGIAKTSDHTTKATKTGTYGYMAPEVYWGKPYNASVDIYSLGLVLYWLLNERRGPFLPLPPQIPTTQQATEALERRMSGEPLPAPKHGSEELKRIVLKACAFDPKDRYANPTEMKRDLERLTIRSDIEAPHTETEQASIPFSTDEDEKTFGVFGGKPSKPEVPPTEEDEKTFGIFGTRQPKEPKSIPADSEATVSAKKVTPVKPAEKPVEPKKEIKPVKTEPEQKEQPVQAEAKPVETKSRKKSKRPVILSIAAAVVIAAVVLIVVLAGKGKTPTPKPTVDPVVVFHDETFENAIREKCGFAGTIYQSDILSVTELDLSECDLTDISDIAQFRNLIRLGLAAFRGNDGREHRNYISDITALSGLTKLEWLDLGDNQISDISALRGLTNLTDLGLSYNQIGDISALSGLTNLEELHLSSNQISDISALSGLTNLERLNLSYNQIGDITALRGLTKLKWLYLGSNQISDISALNGLTNLTDLSLSYNQISDISALSGLTKLWELFLYGNPLSRDQIDELKAKLPNCQIYY